MLGLGRIGIVSVAGMVVILSMLCCFLLGLLDPGFQLSLYIWACGVLQTILRNVSYHPVRLEASLSQQRFDRHYDCRALWDGFMGSLTKNMTDSIWTRKQSTIRRAVFYSVWFLL